MAIGTGAALIGSAIIGGLASNSASKKQAKAAKQGIKATNELIGPYSAAGVRAIPALEQFIGSGENFYDTQAFKDITNSAKAGGAYDSGNRQTALGSYYATNFRPQRLNELGYLYRTGANASAGQATALGNLFAQQGNAQAEGIYGMGLAAQNALGSYAFLNGYKGSGTNNLTGATVAGSGGQTPQQFYGVR